MGLDEELVERVLFLVDVHLLMSHLAQRRDLSDPRLLLDFAQRVGDRTNLRNLYLVTVADVRASSRSAWTQWKGSLLRDLFEKARSARFEADASLLSSPSSWSARISKFKTTSIPSRSTCS